MNKNSKYFDNRKITYKIGLSFFSLRISMFDKLRKLGEKKRQGPRNSIREKEAYMMDPADIG